jgi:transcriptional regulator with XRE-family HTH domain
MAQNELLISALKQALKRNGLTYGEVAKALKLSEASVKRLFASGSFTLERYDQICKLMGLEITDLARMVEENRRLSELTEAQEKDLVADPRMLMIAHLVVNGWTYDELLERYTFTPADLVRALTRLDRLRVIELLPGNRIKVLISPNFAWRRNGPIQRFFVERMQDDYFANQFLQDHEVFMLVPGMLTHASARAVIQKMQELAAVFNDFNRGDRPLPLSERQPYSMVLAIRPWRPAAFAKFRKPGVD